MHKRWRNPQASPSSVHCLHEASYIMKKLARARVSGRRHKRRMSCLIVLLVPDG